MNTKILLVTLDYPPQLGGVAHYYHELHKRLPKHKIIVLAHSKNLDEEKIFDSQQDYQIIRKNFFSFPLVIKWLSLFFIIRNIIKKENIDFIEVGQILPIGTIVCLLNFFYKIPYSVYTHGMDIMYPLQYLRKKFLMKIILKRSKYITTVSNYTKQLIIKNFSIEDKKIFFIRPSVDVNIIKNFVIDKKILAKYNIEKDSFKLITIARLVKRKGHFYVLEALKYLEKRYNIPKKITYIIVGDGDCYDFLKEKVQKMKFSKKIDIIFTKAVCDVDKWQLLAYSDVFVMPSYLCNKGDVEGFGMVFLEANLFKKPVIATNSGGIADAVLDNKTGFLVEPKNSEQIAEKIFLLMNDSNLAKKLGERGYKRVINNFVWEIQINRLKKLLCI